MAPATLTSGLSTDLGEAPADSIMTNNHIRQGRMDLIIAGTVHSVIIEVLLPLLRVHHHHRSAVLHGPRRRTDCHRDHRRQLTLAGQGKSTDLLILREMMGEGDLHRASPAHHLVSIHTFLAMLVEKMEVVIVNVTMGGGLETRGSAETKEVIELGKEKGEAKTIETLDVVGVLNETESGTGTGTCTGVNRVYSCNSLISLQRLGCKRLHSNGLRHCSWGPVQGRSWLLANYFFDIISFRAMTWLD